MSDTATHKPIGGYFELEAGQGALPHAAATAVNSARHALEYILRCRRYTRVHLPLYTCSVVLQPLRRLGVEPVFYPLNPDLEPQELPELRAGEALICNNYFGLKQACVERLAQHYGTRLIVDNAQAFYAAPLPGIDAIYSPRKFFGVPDGGFAYCHASFSGELPRDVSWQRMEHLLRRHDEGAEAGYPTFCTNSEQLDESPLRRMSALTQALLRSVDTARAAQSRRANYAQLHAALHQTNHLSLPMVAEAVPLVYPYLVPCGAELRRRLIAEKIFVASYWPNVTEWAAPGTWEHTLATDLLALPIDQRYGPAEMQRIIECICSVQ